ncbi:MAG: hypothetical protein E5X19_05745 [Mesorhizobium sp.]|nr:MAG: hypothetical protein E5X19_05745 [Mesorhizobium sp.]
MPKSATDLNDIPSLKLAAKQWEEVENLALSEGDTVHANVCAVEAQLCLQKVRVLKFDEGIRLSEMRLSLLTRPATLAPGLDAGIPVG